MLQQTQVERVIPFYAEFTRRFPDIRALARAPLSEVLRAWQGLGYNRRAKMLHDAAKEIITKHKGKLPKEKSTLIALPGVGEYTASAVRVFAFNEPEILLETNIRTVYLHHFFPKKKKVHDRQILELTGVPKGVSPREWHAALMDYGAYLKKTYPNPSRRSMHHAKQKPFKGSDREVRGAIIKLLSKRPRTRRVIYELGFSPARLRTQLNTLREEGLISFSSSRISLAE
jgi:A/G-specific adenine glycosylase